MTGSPPRADAGTTLSVADRDLISLARHTIQSRYRPGWHVVGAALRLRSGRVFTGVHLDANVGRVAVCAEAIALGRAITEVGDADVETIVAVYHPDPGVGGDVPAIVAPCGMCREMIADYAPQARVIVPNLSEAEAVPILSLIPHKFARPTQSL